MNYNINEICSECQEVWAQYPDSDTISRFCDCFERDWNTTQHSTINCVRFFSSCWIVAKVTTQPSWWWWPSSSCQTFGPSFLQFWWTAWWMLSRGATCHWCCWFSTGWTRWRALGPGRCTIRCVAFTKVWSRPSQALSTVVIIFSFIECVYMPVKSPSPFPFSISFVCVCVCVGARTHMCVCYTHLYLTIFFFFLDDISVYCCVLPLWNLSSVLSLMFHGPPLAFLT